MSAPKATVFSAAALSVSLIGLAEITIGPPRPLPLDTNYVRLFQPPEIPRPPGLKNASELSPGIYLTKPFTGMVKVPGGHPDDVLRRPPPGPPPPMPILRPDLKMVPLGGR